MSKFRTAVLCGLLAGAMSAVAAKFNAFLSTDAAWFGLLTEMGVTSPLVDLPEWTNLVAACLAGLGASLFCLYYTRPLAILLVLVVAIIEVFSGSAIAAIFRFAFEPSASAVALLLGSLFAVTASRSATLRREEQLTHAFDGMISRQTLARLSREKIELASPQPFEAAFVICRAHNLRTMLDALPPAEAGDALSIVLDRAAIAAREAGAVVHWCGVTGFDAVFGLANCKNSSVSNQTVEFLLSLADRLREWNTECSRIFGHSIDVRIAAETGSAMPFLNSSANGRSHFASEVGLTAERICAANMEYGATVAIGARLYGTAIDSVEVRPLDFLPTGEGNSPEEIYEVITRQGGLDANQAKRRDAYWKGVILFREGRFDEAIREFENATVAGVNDPPLAWYLQKAIQAQNTLPSATAPFVLKAS